MSLLAFLVALYPSISDADERPYQSLVQDAGFALDAGERGVVLDSSTLDAGDETFALTEKVVVRIVGAQALPNEVLLDAISIGRSDRLNDRTAEKIRRQVQDYLVRTGFQLASVTAKVTPNAIEVDVDEGKIERILCLGELTFHQLRFVLALALPHDVFNRPLLDRQIRELSESMGLEGVKWELVQTPVVHHVGPQIDRLPGMMDLALLGSPVIHKRRPYEVHVLFPKHQTRGVGIDIRSGSRDGAELGLNYRALGMLSSIDSASGAASVGMAIRQRLDTERFYAQFSRAATELRYQFPFKPFLRSGTYLRAELVSRQRADLRLENHEALALEVGTELQLVREDKFQLVFGGGFAWRRLWGFVTDDGSSPLPGVESADRKRPFLSLQQKTVLNPYALRKDHHHSIRSEVRFFLPTGKTPPLTKIELAHRWARALGWHELRIFDSAYFAFGDVTFHDEVSVADLTFGIFGDQFTRLGGQVRAEFRFSITRDLLKVGLFANLAAMGVQPLRDDPMLYAQVIPSFGPAIHHTLLELFQVDLYFTFGFRRREFAFTPVLQISPIY